MTPVPTIDVWKEFPQLAGDVERAPTHHLTLRGEYTFHLFSIGERGSDLTPQVVEEASRGLVERIRPFKGKFDRLLTIEPGGFPWALAAVQQLQVPLSIIRARPSYWGKEEKVKQFGPVYNRFLHFNFRKLQPGSRVVFIDDVISTTKTLSIVADKLREHDIKLIGVVAIVVKGDFYKDFVAKEGVPIRAILKKLAQGDVTAGP